jgi:hypothetical protein
MAEVTLPAPYQKQIWVNDYLKEYIRQSGFERYMGSGATKIIRVIGEAQTEGGKTINIPLIGRLRSAGVSGSQVLDGNEEDQALYMDQVRTNWRRNAVKVPKSSQYQTEIDLLNAAKPQLRTWSAKVVLMQGILDQLSGVVLPGAAGTDGYLVPDTVIAYADATAAQRNTFLVANTDRVLFGELKGNSSSGVFATALATIDNTSDKMKPEIISLAINMAKETGQISATGPAITPFQTDDGEETWVMFVGSRQMRDLRINATMVQANREAMDRGKNNPLFRAGDLLWEGCIIREIVDTPVVSSTIEVQHAFLAGQSAVVVAYGQQPDLITDRDQDYKFRPGRRGRRTDRHQEGQLQRHRLRRRVRLDRRCRFRLTRWLKEQTDDHL